MNSKSGPRRRRIPQNSARQTEGTGPAKQGLVPIPDRRERDLYYVRNYGETRALDNRLEQYIDLTVQELRRLIREDERRLALLNKEIDDQKQRGERMTGEQYNERGKLYGELRALRKAKETASNREEPILNVQEMGLQEIADLLLEYAQAEKKKKLPLVSMIRRMADLMEEDHAPKSAAMARICADDLQSGFHEKLDIVVIVLAIYGGYKRDKEERERQTPQEEPVAPVRYNVWIDQGMER